VEFARLAFFILLVDRSDPVIGCVCTQLFCFGIANFNVNNVRSVISVTIFSKKYSIFIGSIFEILLLIVAMCLSESQLLE